MSGANENIGEVSAAVGRLQGSIQELENKIRDLVKQGFNNTSGHNQLSRRVFDIEGKFATFLQGCGECRVSKAQLESLVMQHDKILNGEGNVIQLARENQAALQAILVEQRTLLAIGKWLIGTVLATGGLVTAIITIF